MNTIKNKLNIIGKCFVKENSAGGEILSFIPDVPISGYLDDFLFILTVPSETQKFATAYVRLQNKSDKNVPQAEIKDFTEVRSVGYIKESKKGQSDIIVIAPKNHTLVDFGKLVVIATIPSADKTSAPCYFRTKVYEKNKAELQKPETSVVIDSAADMNKEQVEQIMKDIEV